MSPSPFSRGEVVVTEGAGKRLWLATPTAETRETFLDRARKLRRSASRHIARIEKLEESAIAPSVREVVLEGESFERFIGAAERSVDLASRIGVQLLDAYSAFERVGVFSMPLDRATVSSDRLVVFPAHIVLFAEIDPEDARRETARRIATTILELAAPHEPDATFEGRIANLPLAWRDPLRSILANETVDGTALGRLRRALLLARTNTPTPAVRTSIPTRASLPLRTEDVGSLPGPSKVPVIPKPPSLAPPAVATRATPPAVTVSSVTEAAGSRSSDTTTSIEIAINEVPARPPPVPPSPFARAPSVFPPAAVARAATPSSSPHPSLDEEDFEQEPTMQSEAIHNAALSMREDGPSSSIELGSGEVEHPAFDEDASTAVAPSPMTTQSFEGTSKKSVPSPAPSPRAAAAKSIPPPVPRASVRTIPRADDGAIGRTLVGMPPAVLGSVPPSVREMLEADRRSDHGALAAPSTTFAAVAPSLESAITPDIAAQADERAILTATPESPRHPDATLRPRRPRSRAIVAVTSIAGILVLGVGGGVVAWRRSGVARAEREPISAMERVQGPLAGSVTSSAASFETAARALRSAVVSHDAERIRSLTAPELVWVRSTGGARDRTAFVAAQLEAAPRELGVSDLHTTVSETTAVARYVRSASGEGPTDLTRVVDVWTRTTGGWALVHRDEMTMEHHAEPGAREETRVRGAEARGPEVAAVVAATPAPPADLNGSEPVVSEADETPVPGDSACGRPAAPTRFVTSRSLRVPAPLPTFGSIRPGRYVLHSVVCHGSCGGDRQASALEVAVNGRATRIDMVVARPGSRSVRVTTSEIRFGRGSRRPTSWNVVCAESGGPTVGASLLRSGARYTALRNAITIYTPTGRGVARATYTRATRR